MASIDWIMVDKLVWGKTSCKRIDVFTHSSTRLYEHCKNITDTFSCNKGSRGLHDGSTSFAAMIMSSWRKNIRPFLLVSVYSLVYACAKIMSHTWTASRQRFAHWRDVNFMVTTFGQFWEYIYGYLSTFDTNIIMIYGPEGTNLIMIFGGLPTKKSMRKLAYTTEWRTIKMPHFKEKCNCSWWMFIVRYVQFHPIKLMKNLI